MKYDFDQSVGYWVGLTAKTLEKAVNVEMAEAGITLRQVQVLACLAIYKQLSQSEIAEQLHIEASTLVRVLDRMQRDGWITREEAPDDRRKKIIRATAKVEPYWSVIIARGQNIEQKAVKGLTDKQLSDLKNTLSIIRNNLGREE